MLWWAWFRKQESSTRNRGFVIFGVVLSTASLAVSRLFAVTLPFRVRPRFDSALHFRMPAISPGFNLINWSSFPSDHAIMFFSLATCFFFISRKMGLLAYLHAFLLSACHLSIVDLDNDTPGASETGWIQLWAASVTLNEEIPKSFQSLSWSS